MKKRQLLALVLAAAMTITSVGQSTAVFGAEFTDIEISTEDVMPAAVDVEVSPVEEAEQEILVEDIFFDEEMDFMEEEQEGEILIEESDLSVPEEELFSAGEVMVELETEEFDDAGENSDAEACRGGYVTAEQFEAWKVDGVWPSEGYTLVDGENLEGFYEALAEQTSTGYLLMEEIFSSETFEVPAGVTVGIEAGNLNALPENLVIGYGDELVLRGGQIEDDVVYIAGNDSGAGTLRLYNFETIAMIDGPGYDCPGTIVIDGDYVTVGGFKGFQNTVYNCYELGTFGQVELYNVKRNPDNEEDYPSSDMFEAYGNAAMIVLLDEAFEYPPRLLKPLSQDDMDRFLIEYLCSTGLEDPRWELRPMYGGDQAVVFAFNEGVAEEEKIDVTTTLELVEIDEGLYQIDENGCIIGNGLYEAVFVTEEEFEAWENPDSGFEWGETTAVIGNESTINDMINQMGAGNSEEMQYLLVGMNEWKDEGLGFENLEIPAGVTVGIDSWGHDLLLNSVNAASGGKVVLRGCVRTPDGYLQVNGGGNVGFNCCELDGTICGDMNYADDTTEVEFMNWNTIRGMVEVGNVIFYTDHLNVAGGDEPVVFHDVVNMSGGDLTVHMEGYNPDRLPIFCRNLDLGTVIDEWSEWDEDGNEYTVTSERSGRIHIQFIENFYTEDGEEWTRINPGKDAPVMRFGGDGWADWEVFDMIFNKVGFWAGDGSDYQVQVDGTICPRNHAEAFVIRRFENSSAGSAKEAFDAFNEEEFDFGQGGMREIAFASSQDMAWTTMVLAQKYFAQDENSLYDGYYLLGAPKNCQFHGRVEIPQYTDEITFGIHGIAIEAYAEWNEEAEELTAFPARVSSICVPADTEIKLIGFKTTSGTLTVRGEGELTLIGCRLNQKVTVDGIVNVIDSNIRSLTCGHLNMREHGRMVIGRYLRFNSAYLPYIDILAKADASIYLGHVDMSGYEGNEDGTIGADFGLFQEVNGDRRAKVYLNGRLNFGENTNIDEEGNEYTWERSVQLVTYDAEKAEAAGAAFMDDIYDINYDMWRSAEGEEPVRPEWCLAEFDENPVVTFNMSLADVLYQREKININRGESDVHYWIDMDGTVFEDSEDKIPFEIIMFNDMYLSYLENEGTEDEYFVEMNCDPHETFRRFGTDRMADDAWEGNGVEHIGRAGTYANAMLIMEAMQQLGGTGYYYLQLEKDFNYIGLIEMPDSVQGLKIESAIRWDEENETDIIYAANFNSVYVPDGKELALMGIQGTSGNLKIYGDGNVALLNCRLNQNVTGTNVQLHETTVKSLVCDTLVAEYTNFTVGEYLDYIEGCFNGTSIYAKANAQLRLGYIQGADENGFGEGVRIYQEVMNGKRAKLYLIDGLDTGVHEWDGEYHTSCLDIIPIDFAKALDMNLPFTVDCYSHEYRIFGEYGGPDSRELNLLTGYGDEELCLLNVSEAAAEGIDWSMLQFVMEHVNELDYTKVFIPQINAAGEFNGDEGVTEDGRYMLCYSGTNVNDEWFMQSTNAFIQVGRADISRAEVTGIVNKAYTGSALTQKFTVTLAGETLVEGKDYTVSYKNNVNAGTATVTLTGKNDYKGTLNKTFSVTPLKLASTDVTIANTYKVYTGKNLTTTVTVKKGGKTLKVNTNYTVAYKNNKNVGTATVTVTGKGNYTGSVSKTFKIIPKNGSYYNVGVLKYKVTKTAVSNGTVMVYAPLKKTYTGITIPSTVTIGGTVFKVTAVNAKAFYGNTKLKAVNIGANITTIGAQAFYGCKALTSIKVNTSKLTSVGSYALRGIHAKCVIKVPAAKLSAYTRIFKGKGQSSTVKITK